MAEEDLRAARRRVEVGMAVQVQILTQLGLLPRQQALVGITLAAGAALRLVSMVVRKVSVALVAEATVLILDPKKAPEQPTQDLVAADHQTTLHTQERRQTGVQVLL